MKISKFFRQPIFQKTSTRWLLIINGLLWLLVFFYSLLRVRPTDTAVVARFSTLNDIVQLSKWYWHYLPAIFLLVCLVINVALAHQLLKADGAVELQRLAVKILLFQFALSLLTATVAYQMTSVL